MRNFLVLAVVLVGNGSASFALAEEAAVSRAPRTYPAKGGTVELRPTVTHQRALPVFDAHIVCDAGYNHMWIAWTYKGRPVDRHFCIPAEAKLTDLVCEYDWYKGKAYRTACTWKYDLTVDEKPARLDEYAVLSVVRASEAEVANPLCYSLPRATDAWPVNMLGESDRGQIDCRVFATGNGEREKVVRYQTSQVSAVFPPKIPVKNNPVFE